MLNDGKVLIAGGLSSSQVSFPSELYDPSTGTFTQTGTLNTPRYYHTATLLQNGTVLIAGGISNANPSQLVGQAEIYNPATSSFQVTGTMITPRFGFTATRLQDGTVLIAGGENPDGDETETAEIYNPVNGTFTRTGNIITPRLYAAATLLPSGKVLITGGVDNSNHTLSSTELYDPSSHTFTAASNMHSPRQNHTATTLDDGTVLIAGGFSDTVNYTATSSAEIYDPSANTFTTVGNMNTGTAGHTATILNNGQVLIAGGAIDNKDSLHLTLRAELYDPATKTFIATGSMSGERVLHTATLLADGSVLIAGGEDSSQTPLTTAEIYTSQADSGSIDPKFIILAVTYAPPGHSSSVDYTDTTVFGTTTSISNAFTDQTSVSVSTGGKISIFGTAFGETGTRSTSYTQGETTSSLVSVNKTTTNTLSIPGPANSAVGIDHDYDIVWVWLNPKVNLTVGSTPGILMWTGYSYDLRDEQDMDVVALYVYCLKNLSSTDPHCTGTQQRTARTWDTSGLGGLDSNDFAQILAADPFATNPDFDPRVPDPTTGALRFDLQQGIALNYELPPPGGQPITQGQTVSYQTTTTSGKKATNSYQVGFSLDSSFTGGFLGDITYDLKNANTTTWENSWGVTSSDSGTQTAAVSITGPATSDSYTGPTDFEVFKDNVYGTLMLYAPPQPPVNPQAASIGSPTAAPTMNGNMADSITAADFDGDGTLDVAVAYLEDNVIRVALSSTGQVVVVPVGNQPYDVVSGDLNGDGYPDLVTANTGDGTVSVLLNGSAQAVGYSVGSHPFQVAIGDLNGDGIPDLAVTNNGDNTASILYGGAGGTFVAGPALSTGTQPYGIAIGDFNYDGKNDIAVTCYATSQLYIFSNKGDGTFASPGIYATDLNPAGLVVGDFNRDGKLDIVTGNTIANDISFFAGHSDGTFRPGVIGPSLNFPVSIAAGDVNGDGILDIVGVAPNFNAVVITLGRGDGTFGTTAERQVFSVGQQPWDLVLGNFFNDGKLDIATANTYYQVNLATTADQQRYEQEYPPVAGGNPNAYVMMNITGNP